MATWDHDALSDAFGVYVHVPFCTKKCPYCDFSTAPYVADRVDPLLAAVASEASSCSDAAHAGVTSVFIGGGTPSLLGGDQLARLLTDLRSTFTIRPGSEISIEANPEHLDSDKLAAYRDAGVNRLSIGAQSFDGRALSALGREHSADDTRRAVASARSAGLENVSLDIMFGGPSENHATWQATVEDAIALSPDHLSVYGLTLEPKTVYGRLSRRGALDLPDEDSQAAMYDASRDALESAGYRQYEISNFARPGYECRHNLTYWRNQPYVGLGPSAWGYLGGERYGNIRGTLSYLKRMESDASPVEQRERLVGRRARAEALTLGLRLTTGVDAVAFRARYGTRLEEDFGKEIDLLLEWGLLEWAQEADETRHLRLTRRGTLLSDEVFLRLLPSGQE